MPDDLDNAQRSLNAARARARRAKAGPPLVQTDSDLDALSAVTPALLAEVEAFTRDAVGQFGVDLIRAERG
jgi:hypothetical protein